MLQQQRWWLALATTRGFSPRLLKRLYLAFGSVERLFTASSAELAQAELKPALRKQLREVQRQADNPCSTTRAWLADSPQHHLLCLEDAAYPERLRQLDDPPPVLFVHGDPELLAYPQIALVGSRKASHQGLRDAHAFACELSNAGLIPTSGLALGIDGRVHQGALAGRGLTVAVLGCGVDRPHPNRHRRLAEEIVAGGGALVSEFPLGTPPLPAYFPQRNRIISGLSLGVLVVEATLRSGSLITARLASEQGREVFALPGSIHNPAHRGCHQLIRQGALLVESAAEIIAELAPQLDWATVPTSEPQGDKPAVPAGLSQAAQQVLTATGFEPTPLDLVVARCGLGAAQVQSELLALELDGLIAAVMGGYQRC